VKFKIIIHFLVGQKATGKQDMTGSKISKKGSSQSEIERESGRGAYRSRQITHAADLVYFPKPISQDPTGMAGQ